MSYRLAPSEKKENMKKLIALLLILTLCLTGCDMLGSIIGGDAIGNNTQGGGNQILIDPEDCTSHADSDDDGYCDLCREYVIVVIDLYSINDLHGKVSSSNTQPGLAVLTSYLDSVLNENSILLSSGDMWQGTAESSLSHGNILTDWMNDMGFVAMTVGNHEYDWGQDRIRENDAISAMPFLGINVYDNATGERADYVTSSVVVERGGVQIGIIGAIGDCYSSISGEVSGDFYFKVRGELTSLVKAESERLRKEGVDFIIYSLHDGYDQSMSGIKDIANNKISSYYDVSLSNGYVDIVFEAHTHQSYILRDVYGVYHMQGSGENKGLSHAEIGVNSANGNSYVDTVELVDYKDWGNQSQHSVVDALLLKYKDVIDRANETLGNNPKYRDDTDVEQLVADLYYQYGVEKWGEEYDIVLGGGFLRTRSPYNLYAGNVTYSSLFSLLPFDNEIVLCTIKGRDLKSKFINTNNSDYYVSYGDYDISSIDDNATYYVVTDTYTSTYKYNNLTEVARYAPEVYARDLVADFVKKGGWS